MKTLIHASILIYSVLLMTATCEAAEHTKDSLEKVRTGLDKEKAVLLDVREQKEWNAGHLKDAMLLPLSKLRAGRADKKFAAQLEKKLPKKKIVYCHCRSGRRVLAAADILGKLGYDVRPLKTGYAQLLEAGFEQAKEKKD